MIAGRIARTSNPVGRASRRAGTRFHDPAIHPQRGRESESYDRSGQSSHTEIDAVDTPPYLPSPCAGVQHRIAHRISSRMRAERKSDSSPGAPGMPRALSMADFGWREPARGARSADCASRSRRPLTPEHHQATRHAEPAKSENNQSSRRRWTSTLWVAVKLGGPRRFSPLRERRRRRVRAASRRRSHIPGRRSPRSGRCKDGQSHSRPR